MLTACPAQTMVLAAHAEPGPVVEWGQNLKLHNPAAGCTGGEGPDEQDLQGQRAAWLKMVAGGSRERKGQGGESPAELQNGTTLSTKGKHLYTASQGNVEMDLTDSIWTECASLNMPTVFRRF